MTSVIVIAHNRPTLLLGRWRTPGQRRDLLGDVSASADDARSTVRLVGYRKQVRAAEQILRLADTAPRTVRLHLVIHSEVDHRDTEITVKLYEKESWKTMDADTKIGVALTPVIGSDGTVTLTMVADHPDGHEEARFRVGKKRPVTLKLGDQHTINMEQLPNGSFVKSETIIPGPVLTFSIG